MPPKTKKDSTNAEKKKDGRTEKNSPKVNKGGKGVHHMDTPHVKLNSEKQNIFNVIEQEQNNINDIGHYIWRYAEVGGKELQSCKKIVDFLKNRGFRMTSHCAKFDTAFRLEFGHGEVGGKSHPNIGFLCEYSADPKSGHSKGHNLVSSACIAAAIGLQRVIGFSKVPLGRVTVIGCPSNEDNTMKKVMLDAGCFRSIDCILTAYPANFTCLQPAFISSSKVSVTFKGRSTSEGVERWESANPVNAVVLAQQNMAVHRQNFNADWTINGVIPSAGNDPAKQPQTALCIYQMRAPTKLGIKVLSDKLRLCLEGASMASGCTFEEEVIGTPIVSNVNCPLFAESYRTNARLNGFTFHDERKDLLLEADDISFISQAIPTFKMFYYAGTATKPGTDEFNRYCGSTEAEYMNIVQGKSLAMMAVDLMMEEEKLLKTIGDHQASVEGTTNYPQPRNSLKELTGK